MPNANESNDFPMPEWSKANDAMREWAKSMASDADQRHLDTLHHSFTLAALTGLLSGRTSAPEYPNIVAVQAFEMADAMMKVHARRTKG